MSNQNFIIMSTFYDFAQRYFAEKLGVPVEQVEKIYEMVQKYFYISVDSSKFVYPNKPETFSATLVYSDEDESSRLVGFNKDGQSEFTTPEEAFDVALFKVNNIIIVPNRGDCFLPLNIPTNALILFDTEKAKEQFARSYPN